MNLELAESDKSLQYQAERYGEFTAKLGRGIKPLAEYFCCVGAFPALGSIFDLIDSESEFGRGMLATVGLGAFFGGGIE